MLNHQLILTDSAGRLRTTLATPEPLDFNGGTPVRDGLLCVVDIDGVYFVNSLAYGPESRITSEQAAPGIPEGNPFVNARGRLRSSIDAPMFWLYGLPFTGDGRLCLVPPDVPPPEVGAFSSAFSSAYD